MATLAGGQTALRTQTSTQPGSEAGGRHLGAGSPAPWHRERGVGAAGALGPRETPGSDQLAEPGVV